MSYQTNIIFDTSENRNFRTVLYTGSKSQLVVMNIPAGGEIGQETHENVEQTLFFLAGEAVAILDGVTSKIRSGDALIVTPGTEHNILNTGTTDLKIYTIYTPPNHLDGRIHATKADADKDEEDEAFGHGLGSATRLHRNGHPETLSTGPANGNEVTPGYYPEIEPHPDPGSPLENPDEPTFPLYADALDSDTLEHVILETFQPQHLAGLR